MSFASILSGPTEEERPPPRRPSPPPAQMAPPIAPPPPFSLHDPKLGELEPASVPAPLPRLEEKQGPKERRRNVEPEPSVGDFSAPHPANGAVPDVKKDPAQSRPPAPRKTLSERDLQVINKITVDIDNEDKSDVESPGFEAEFDRYISKGKKRALNTERAENIRRKVCF